MNNELNIKLFPLLMASKRVHRSWEKFLIDIIDHNDSRKKGKKIIKKLKREIWSCNNNRENLEWRVRYGKAFPTITLSQIAQSTMLVPRAWWICKSKSKQVRKS